MTTPAYDALAIASIAVGAPCLITRFVRQVMQKKPARIDGWINWSLALSILGFMVAGIVPAVLCAGLAADMGVRDSSMRNWQKAIMQYAYDNDDRLPLVDNWDDAVREYLDPERESSLSDPVSELEFGIGFNAAIAGRYLSDCPNRTVILVSGKNAARVERGEPIVDDEYAALQVLGHGRLSFIYRDDVVWVIPDEEPSEVDSGDE